MAIKKQQLLKTDVEEALELANELIPGFQKLLLKEDDWKENANKVYSIIPKEYINYLEMKEPNSIGIFVQRIIFAYFFKKYDKKTFSLDESLFHALSMTDIKNVDDYFLELPFPCININMDNNHNFTYGKELVESVCICLFKQGDKEKELNVMIGTKGIYNKGSYTFSMKFSGGDIFKQLNKKLKSEINDKDFIDMISKIRNVTKEEVSEFYKLSSFEINRIMCFVISFIFLLKTSGKIKEEKIFPMSYSKKDSKLPMCKIYPIIPIDSSGYKPSSGNTEEDKKRNIYILKWTVRGHFRNQAKGVGLKERELIWIEPFIKGGERTNESINLPHKEYYVK